MERIQRKHFNKNKTIFSDCLFRDGFKDTWKIKCTWLSQCVSRWEGDRQADRVTNKVQQTDRQTGWHTDSQPVNQKADSAPYLSSAVWRCRCACRCGSPRGRSSSPGPPPPPRQRSGTAAPPSLPGTPSGACMDGRTSAGTGRDRQGQTRRRGRDRSQWIVDSIWRHRDSDHDWDQY